MQLLRRYSNLGPESELAAIVEAGARVDKDCSRVDAGNEATGGVAVFPSDDTDLLVDINGYFSTDDPNGLVYYPLFPCRLLDTRQGSGAFSGLLSPPVDVKDSPCGAGPTAWRRRL